MQGICILTLTHTLTLTHSHSLTHSHTQGIADSHSLTLTHTRVWVGHIVIHLKNTTHSHVCHSNTLLFLKRLGVKAQRQVGSLQEAAVPSMPLHTLSFSYLALLHGTSL